MQNFNKHNPTLGWTEDEKYEFCKPENKWVKELPKSVKRKVGVAGAANEPAFSSVEEINIAFENDILSRKENWKHLCHICEYATNNKGNLAMHLAVHGRDQDKWSPTIYSQTVNNGLRHGVPICQNWPHKAAE